MADEMTDKSNREQIVLCLRWVSDNFDVHEEFIGVYMVEVCNATTLVSYSCFAAAESHNERGKRTML